MSEEDAILYFRHFMTVRTRFWFSFNAYELFTRVSSLFLSNCTHWLLIRVWYLNGTMIEIIYAVRFKRYWQTFTTKTGFKLTQRSTLSTLGQKILFTKVILLISWRVPHNKALSKITVCIHGEPIIAWLSAYT